jgi:hypothetical protein
MKIDPNRTKVCLDKVAKASKSELLVATARELIQEAQLWQGELKPELIRVRLARRADLPRLEKMINLAYHWRYCGERGAKLASFSEAVIKPNVKTLVATIKAGQRELLLATTRLVRDDLELFSFFKFKDGREWSHRQAKLTPYEMERLAYHPLFELLPERGLQLEIMRRFMAKVATLIKKPYWLGCTMRANVKKFMDAAGLRTKEIDGLEFCDNQVTAYLVDLFPDYFQDFKAYEIDI